MNEKEKVAISELVKNCLVVVNDLNSDPSKIFPPLLLLAQHLHDLYKSKKSSSNATNLNDQEALVSQSQNTPNTSQRKSKITITRCVIQDSTESLSNGLEQNEETQEVAPNSANKENENDQEVNGEQDNVEKDEFEAENMQTDYLPDMLDDKKSTENEIDEAEPVHEDIQASNTFDDQISTENVINEVESRVEEMRPRIIQTEHVDQIEVNGDDESQDVLLDITDREQIVLKNIKKLDLFCIVKSI